MFEAASFFILLLVHRSLSLSLSLQVRFILQQCHQKLIGKSVSNSPPFILSPTRAGITVFYIDDKPVDEKEDDEKIVGKQNKNYSTMQTSKSFDSN